MSTNYIDYEGYRYWYEHRPGRRGDICLATQDPTMYCNGLYAYSPKDPGDGMCYVVVQTDNPEYDGKIKKRRRTRNDDEENFYSDPDNWYKLPPSLARKEYPYY